VLLVVLIVKRGGGCKGANHNQKYMLPNMVFSSCDTVWLWLRVKK